MKKAILIQLLMALTMAAFSQTKPTKEETIAWIKSKMVSYGSEIKAKNGGTYYYIANDAGIELKVTYGGQTTKSSIVYNNVIGYTIMDSDPDFKIFSVRDKQGQIFDIFLPWQEEADFYNRFERALKDLVQHNKPKETY